MQQTSLILCISLCFTFDQSFFVWSLHWHVFMNLLMDIFRQPFPLSLRPADTTNEKRKNYVTITRYLTYLGMCIATCVIFQSSTIAASAVGLAVALYISVSEYWLTTYQSPGEKGMPGGGGPIPLEDLLNHN